MTTYTWQGAGTSVWGTASNWTPAGGPPSTTSDTALFTGSATYTAKIASGISYVVGAVTLNDTNAAFDLLGTLSVGTSSASGIFTLDAGSFDLGNSGSGTVLLNYATVVDNGGTVLFGGGTLLGVTWQGTLDLSAANAKVYIRAVNGTSPANTTAGLVLEGAGGVGNGTVLDTGSGSALWLYDYQSLNNATIDLGAATGSASIHIGQSPANTTAATAILGSGLTILSSGSNGQAALDGSNANDAFINEGTITAAAASGHFSLSATLTNQGTIQVQNGDALVIGTDTVTNTSTGTITVDATSSLSVNSTLLDQGGTVTVASGGSFVVSSGDALTGYGAITGSITANGTVTASGGTLAISGSVNDLSMPPTGSLVVDSGATLTVGGSVSAPVVSFATSGTNETFGFGATSNATQVQGFALTDTLWLTGVSDSNSDINATYASGTLTITRGVSNTFVESFTLGGSVNYAGATFTAAADARGGTDITTTACYCPGTLILTDRGEVAVEDLVIGDRLVTGSGEARALKWIGRRSYIGWLAAANPKVWPVCFRSGALADGVPRRPLWVSPEHAMFLDGALFPAGLLVNGISITQTQPADEVHYIHLELDSHDVIWAERALAESFIDDDSRGIFHNAAEFRLLYPDAANGPALFCAPRIEAGHELDSLQRRLIERARLLGVDGRASPRGLTGHLDLVSSCIAGWARYPACPGIPVRLVVFANGVEIGRVVADRYRADLLHAGIGDGRHGFEFLIRGGLAPDIRHEIEVRSEDGWVMPSRHSTVIVPLLTPDQKLADRPLAGLGPLRGNCEEADRLSIKGWAQDEADPERRVGLVITVNGRVAGRVLANCYRRDLEEAGLGSGKHAFQLVFTDGLPRLAAQEIRIAREADGVELPGSPVHLQAVAALDDVSEAQFAALLGQLGDEAAEDRALKLLTTQTELLLTRRAARRSGRSEREALRQFRRRWGPDAAEAIERRNNAALQALVVDELLPCATRDAGSVAILSHVRALQTLGYSVTFAAANDMRNEPAAAALKSVSVAVCSAPHYASVEDVLRLHAGTFDVVYLHRAGIADRYLPLVRQYCPRARVVYSVADLHHVRLARQSKLERRPELLAHSRNIAAIEIMAAQRADLVLTHSPVEAALLERAVGPNKVHVVPFAVRSRQPSRAVADRQGVVFVGSFGHAPNVDAVHYLLRDLLPLVWARKPSITCQLVGHGWGATQLPGLDPRVSVVGPVDDLATVFAVARLSVAPLRYGAGIKGKVLDSFAAGLPCAMSPIAAEGLPLPGLLPQLVGDGAASLAACILRLHTDLAFNKQAGQEAAALAAREFGPEQVKQALAAALGRTSIADGKSQAA